MAQQVNIILIDDMDGSDAVETVYFGLDGTEFEIDLSAKNAAQLRARLGEFAAVARRASKKGRRTTEASPSEIRKWARETGRDVPARGRVSADIRAAFSAAQ
jgi:hypothetical protein